jgi:regulator of PEP synthase PpsR (kinase-PPPase family)
LTEAEYSDILKIMAVKKRNKINPVYIVSGGSGTSGKQIVYTILAQFPNVQIPVIKKAHIRNKKQIKDIVSTASKTGGIIVHTLIESDLRKTLIQQGKELNIMTVDIMGSLFDKLTATTGQKPLVKPGLYHKQHQEYLDYIDSIDFTVTHDDGQRTKDLKSADIVIIGVSRSGKTPLSMYMAVHGWKVANIPIIKEVPMPEEINKIDRHRIIGLNIEYEQLLIHRKKRQDKMGTGSPSVYSNPSYIAEELEVARKIYRKGKFHVVSVTNKPIETTADEIIEYVTSYFKDKTRKI